MLSCLQPGGVFKLFCFLHIPSQVAVGIHFPFRKTVAHEPKNIPRTVCDIEVLPSDIAEHPIEQVRTPAKQRGHSTINTITLVPALASAAPDKSLVYLICVADECIDYVLLGLNVLDVFSRHLLDPLDEIIARPVQRLH